MSSTTEPTTTASSQTVTQSVSVARCACAVCDERHCVPISRRSREGGELVTVLCAGCGVARTDPIPSAEELAEYYASEYRLDYKGVMIPRKKHVLRASRLARERLAHLRPLLQEGDRMLDVGAGGGEFVALARAVGFAAEGIEPNQGYANHASGVLGLPVRQGLWQSAEVGKESLAAVTMFHVLEHLPDPLNCLLRVSEWLRPGGFLFVEVPNLLAPLGTRSRRFHRAHLVHFTPETLAATLRRAGLRVTEATAPGDGGNVRALARKVAPDDVPPSSHQTEAELEHTTVEQILSHERSSHFRPSLLVPHTRRFAGRLLSALEEQLTVLRLPDAKAVLAAVLNEEK